MLCLAYIIYAIQIRYTIYICICRSKERERFNCKFNWNCPMQGLVIQSLSVEYQQKFSFSHSYLLLRCSLEYARDS